LFTATLRVDLSLSSKFRPPHEGFRQAMPTGNGENPQVYGQWTIDDPQNWLFASRLRRQRVFQHGFPGLSTSKNQGTVPP